MKKHLIFCILLVIFSACDLIPPKAGANQLNENSSYLEQFQENIYIARSNGDIIGIFRDDLINSTHSDISYDHLSIRFNNNFYKTILNVQEGTIGDNWSILYFKVPSCEGVPHMRLGVDNGKIKFFSPRKGKVFEYQESVYYYPKNSPFYAFSYQSLLYRDGDCVNQTEASDGLYIKLLPNDPSVTGIKNYPFPSPITIDGINEAAIIRE